jgi:hypothetical protein
MASNKKPNTASTSAPKAKPRATLKYSALIQSGKAGGIPIDTAAVSTTDGSEFAASGQSVPLYDMTGAAVFMLPPQLEPLIGEVEYQKLLKHLRQQFDVLILRIGGKVIYVDMAILPMEFDVNAPPTSAVSAMPISPVRAKTRPTKSQRGV